MIRVRRTIICVVLLLTCGLALSVEALAAKIVIDPGHGGSDPGTIGVNGLQEKDVNLDIAKRLRKELQSRGYEVEMTREKDEYVRLADRVEFTDRAEPDAFVSIHANMYKNPQAKGTLVLYYDDQYPQANYPASAAMKALTAESKRLAQLVLQGIVEAAGTANKGLVPSAAYVVRSGTVPSVLVETAFLSNWEDAAALANPATRGAMARGIADGIEAYKPAQTDGFTDLNGHWAKEAITRLRNKGIVEGEGNRFFPNRSLTRAEFVAMLERQFPLPVLADRAPNGGACAQSGAAADGGSVSGSSSCAVPFRDLKSDHWAADAITKAYRNGVLDGYADGTIRPDQPITRGEAAVLLDRVLWPHDKPRKLSGPFKDAPSSLWSAPAINRLQAKGIVEGVSPDRFAPERAITRAEMSAILNRLIKE